MSVGAAAKPMPRPMTNDVAPTCSTLEDRPSSSSSAVPRTTTSGADERGEPEADPQVDAGPTARPTAASRA